MTGNGNFSTSATNTMTLASANTYSDTNTFNSTVEINGTLEDAAGNFGTAGQILAVNAAGTGVEWVNAASATAPTLQIVLDNGNTAAQDINLTGDIDLTGNLYFQASSTINAGGTIGTNGYPYTTPLNYVYYNDKIYFHSAKVGHKLSNIKENSNFIT